MAAALVEYAQSKSIQPKQENVAEFRILPGKGIYGEMDGKHVYIGNKRALARGSWHKVPEKMDDLKGVSIGYVICDEELVGVFSLSDDCRTGAAEAIRELRSMDITSVMLTGDSAEAATHAQEQLGGVLEELHSELFPKDKVRLVGALKARAGPTMVVGDGMNDAPALAMADVGVSMGISGSAAAMETSHATLMSSDILRVPDAVRLGRRARRTIAVNVVTSVAAKAAVLVLALVWRPVLWAAVLADVGTCLLVVLNSMLLLGEGNSHRGRGKEEACRATARSLDMRIAALASDAGATASVERPGGDKDCHCCQKQSKFHEHSVAIDIRADEDHQEELTCASANAEVTGSDPAVMPTYYSSCASQGCCSGETDSKGGVQENGAR